MTELAAPLIDPDTSGTRLCVLGDFALHHDGDVVGVAPAQQRLLALLAVARRPVARGSVGQRLLDVDDQRSGSAVRSALWRLPRPGGRPLVEVRRGLLSLHGDVEVDLWTSERHARLLDEGPDESTVRCVAGLLEGDHASTWSQELLPGWDEQWLEVERESYHQVRLHALERLSQRLLDQGRHGPALVVALTAVQADPLRESAHRQVVAIHLDEGNPAEALRQFHAYRRLLAHELGLPPSPAIRELVAPLLGRPLEGTGGARRRRAPAR